MGIAPLVGHEDLRRRLAGAISGDRLPQVLLLVGPDGVGKQRLGLWITQRLFCEEPGGVEPCGGCRPCRLVLGLSHPDLHWFIPVPRPKAGDQDKQVDEVEESIAEVVAERRKSPLWGTPDGMAIHGVATARLIGRREALRPVEAPRKVLLIGHAERLVPQESSPDAANALLKLLEEPGPNTVVILTARDVQRVLPTIRSRATPVRLGRLPDEVVGRFLADVLDPAPSEAAVRERVAAADGSIGAAISGSAVGSTAAREAAEAFLEVLSRGNGEGMEVAMAQSTFQARGDFSAMLDALADALGDAARERLGGPVRRKVPGPLRGGRKRSAPPDRLAWAIDRVQSARERAQGNQNPQLLLAGLVDDLREVV